MLTNLCQHDKFIAYCRQLLPDAYLSRLVNLGLLVMALLSSQDSHLSSLAEVIPSAATDLSIEQRLRRWLKNPAIDVRTWYAPFLRAALQQYESKMHYVVMDSTQYGPSCRALVVGLAYNGQVIPLAWQVIKGKKGHSDPALQYELLQAAAAYLPPGRIVLVADSEFCAVELLRKLVAAGWSFMVRVRGNVTVAPAQGEAFLLAHCGLQVGQTQHWPAATWTAAHHFGPLLVIATWKKGEDEPLYLITNTGQCELALRIYAWRFWIEPLFADYKGRGFRLGLTRLRQPERLSRLLLAACIALLWTLALGSKIAHSPDQRLVDRNDRSDRSLFQLGFRFIKRCWKLAQPAPIRFQIDPRWFPLPLTL